METSPNSTYSVENITKRRREKQEELERSKKRMQGLAQELFAPRESKNKIEGLMQHVNTGIAAYDGIMTGIKILQRIRNFFGRKKRR